MLLGSSAELAALAPLNPVPQTRFKLDCSPPTHAPLLVPKGGDPALCAPLALGNLAPLQYGKGKEAGSDEDRKWAQRKT